MSGMKVSTIVSQYYATKINELVISGKFRNQSEVVRQAIREFIDNMDALVVE